LQKTSTDIATPAASDFFVFEATHGFEIFYDSGTTKSIQEYYQTGSIIINGSYFGGTKPGKYYPAGLWIENKKIKYPQMNDDPNITHTVFYMNYGNRVSIIKNSDTTQMIPICLQNPAGCIAFQTWPLVLSGNILQNFWDSWHANGKHARTLLGKTKSGKIFFFVSTIPRSLREVWEKILADARFMNDPITVLNLDGGPSTAFFDGIRWFQSDKKLPIIFRIN
jgi:exopolysaccharide biosynthesis protein